MTDRYADHSSSLISPAAGAFAISPHDTDALPEIVRGLYVGVGGTVAVEMLWGGTISFLNVPDGALLPIRARKVLTSSTATAMVGLY